jgi:hypothetical protein
MDPSDRAAWEEISQGGTELLDAEPPTLVMNSPLARPPDAGGLALAPSLPPPSHVMVVRDFASSPLLLLAMFALGSILTAAAILIEAVSASG